MCLCRLTEAASGLCHFVCVAFRYGRSRKLPIGKLSQQAASSISFLVLLQKDAEPCRAMGTGDLCLGSDILFGARLFV